jgi:hypothetical protein
MIDWTLNEMPDGHGDLESDEFLSALSGDQGDGARKLRVILATMADDEWLQYVLHWRKQPDLEETTLDLDARHPAS